MFDVNMNLLILGFIFSQRPTFLLLELKLFATRTPFNRNSQSIKEIQLKPAASFLFRNYTINQEMGKVKNQALVEIDWAKGPMKTSASDLLGEMQFMWQISAKFICYFSYLFFLLLL